MAATTVYSSRFDSDGVPVQGRPREGIGRLQSDGATVTVATTSLDEANDRVAFIPIADRREIVRLYVEAEDPDSGGTPALDMDIVLYTVDADDNVTETILWNAGTGFQAAISTPRVILLDHVRVPRSASGYSWIGLKVNTAAATAAEADIHLQADFI